MTAHRRHRQHRAALLRERPAVIAAWFVDCSRVAFRRASNFVPGSGGEIGDLIVSTRARYISFTGSERSRLAHQRLAAKTAPGQKWIMRRRRDGR